MKLQWSSLFVLKSNEYSLSSNGTVHTQWERTPRNLTWKLSFKLIQSQSFSYWTSIEVVTANTWEHFELLRSTQNQLLKIHNGAKLVLFDFDFRIGRAFMIFFQILWIKSREPMESCSWDCSHTANFYKDLLGFFCNIYGKGL